MWLHYHPTVIHDTVERYRILETESVPGDQGRMANLGAAVPDYTSYFTWTFLFRVGGPNITTSTGLIGVFLLPVAILFPIGIVALARRRDPVPSWPIVAGLLFAPLPAAFSGHIEAIQRALLLLPFTSLIVGAGFGALQRSGVLAWRIGALVAVAAAPIQFVPFLQDYLGAHRLRSAFYFDSVAFGDVADHLVKIEPLPAVFLRRNLDAAPARWRFHLTKSHRRDLLPRTFYFSDIAETAAAPVDSRIVMYVEGDVDRKAAGGWRVDGRSDHQGCGAARGGRHPPQGRLKPDAFCGLGARWIYCIRLVWRIITLVALLWPSHLSGWFDGAPLDSLAEALLVGLITPTLLWLHPSFLRKTCRSRNDRRDSPRQARRRPCIAAGRLVHHI